MDRRQFLSISRLKSKQKNKLLDNDVIVNYSLSEFSGEWNKSKANHLLRRTLFGVNSKELNITLNDGLNKSVDNLLTIDEQLPEPPVKFIDNQQYDDGLEIGDTFINEPLASGVELQRILAVNSWWIENINTQSYSVREKMTLFWHNHFATKSDTVRVGRFQYATNQLFRENALGNYKNLVTKIGLDQNMMLFLNGNENITGRPNENYARELFELFSIGKGPQISEGNYTNYTEQDIQEAAKILTGWNFDYAGIRTNNYDIDFRPTLHDYSTKKFSKAFQEKTIFGSGENEYYELINMLFDQVETSKYIVRELYKWFVFYEIDDNIENNIIVPLAQVLRNNDFEVKSVLEILLKSEHFFDTAFIGAMIKNPVDFIASISKPVNLNFEPGGRRNFDPITIKYLAYYYNYFNKANEFGMELTNPPSVAGWDAYFQKPNYYRIWLSSVTLPARIQYLNQLFSNAGTGTPVPIKGSGIEILSDLESPNDPNNVVDYICEQLISFEITQEFKGQLKGYLVTEGLGDYTWSEAWYSYELDPENALYKASVEQKLNNLIVAISSLSEFQLM
ncbi:DUF1800 domain-containing protein [Candidatus Kapabacteria bacterium]|nr:DUF1800 domain-containing protein [Candidatus Kapabacteria bacterium]